MPSSLSGFLPFSVMPVRILLCWVFSVMDFSMCDCWVSVQTDNSTKAQKHFLSRLTLQHCELLLMIYPKLQEWASWHQTFSSFCRFCVLRVFCVHPKTDGSYSSVQQSSSVVRHLLKTHQWPTLMHWVTRSFMTGEHGYCCLLWIDPQSRCHKCTQARQICTHPLLKMVLNKWGVYSCLVNLSGAQLFREITELFLKI